MLKLTGHWNSWLEIFRGNKLSLENIVLRPGGFIQKVHLAFKHSTPDNSSPGAGLPHLHHIQATSLVSSLTQTVYHMNRATWPSDPSKPAQIHIHVAQPAPGNPGMLPPPRAAPISVGSASRKQMSLP